MNKIHFPRLIVNVSVGGLVSSVLNKPEGSEQTCISIITAKTTLDDTSNAIWSNIPSAVVHTIKVNGGAGSSRTNTFSPLIHDISESAKPSIPGQYINQGIGI